MNIKTDPIENTEEFKKIEEELEAKIVKEIGEQFGMGYCYLYWATKKRILKQDYNIEWQSPGDLNPRVRFD